MLQFTLNTSPLTGTQAYLAFDLIDGDGIENNIVAISHFSTDGALGVPIITGNVSGALTNSIILKDIYYPNPPDPPSIFNEFLQPLTLGSEVRFTVELTEQQASGALFPDSFSLLLLDDIASGPLFATTDDPDPAYSTGTLFQIDIDGSAGGVVRQFAPVDPDLAVSWRVTSQTAVPLPSTALLIGAGLLGGLAARRWTNPLAT